MEISFDTGKWFTLSSDAYWLLNALVHGGTIEEKKGVPTSRILSLDGYAIIVIFVGFLIVVARALLKREKDTIRVGGSYGPTVANMNSVASDPPTRSDNDQIFSWDGELNRENDHFVHSTDVGSDLLSEEEARVFLHHLYVQRHCDDLLIPNGGCLETIEEESNFSSLSPPNSESGFDLERNGDWTTEKYENDPDRITVVEMDAVIQPLPNLQPNDDDDDEFQVSYENGDSLSKARDNFKCQEFYDNNMNVRDKHSKFANQNEEEVKFVNDIELYNDYEIVEKTILEGLCNSNLVDLLEPLGLLNQPNSTPVNETNGINVSVVQRRGKPVSDHRLISLAEGSRSNKSIIGCQDDAQARNDLSDQVEREPNSLSWQVNRAKPANRTGNLLIQSEERVGTNVEYSPRNPTAIDPDSKKTMDSFKQIDIDNPGTASDIETVEKVEASAVIDENEGKNSTHAIDARLRNLLKRSEERQTRTECLLNVTTTVLTKGDITILKQKTGTTVEAAPSTDGINRSPATSLDPNPERVVVFDKKLSISTPADFATPTTDDEEEEEKEENILPSKLAAAVEERGPNTLVAGGKLKLDGEVITATEERVFPCLKESLDENTPGEISRNSEFVPNGRDCDSRFLEEDSREQYYQQKQKTRLAPSSSSTNSSDVATSTSAASAQINFETFSQFLPRGGNRYSKEFGDLKQTSSDPRLTKKSFPDLPVSFEPVSSNSCQSTPSLYRSNSDPQLSATVYAEFQGSLSFDETNTESYSRLYEEPFAKLSSEDKNLIDRTAATSSPKDVAIKKITASPGKSKYSLFSSLKLAGHEDNATDMEVQSAATSPNNKGIISVHVREMEIRATSPCSPFLARTCETLQLSPPSRPPRKRSESGSSEGRHPILRSPSRSPASSSPAPNVSFESNSSGTGSIRDSLTPSPVSSKPSVPKKPILSARGINNSPKYEEIIPVFGVKPPVPPNKPVHLNLNGHPRKPFVYKPLSIATTKINPEEMKEKITGYEAASHAKPTMNGKPPLPPLPSSRIGLGVKGRVASARKQYFEKNGKNSNSRSESPAAVVHDRLKQFCAETQEERVRLAKSTPDVLAEVENSMRGSRSIDRAPVEDNSASPGEGIGLRTSPYRRKEKREAEIAWPSYRQKPHEGSGLDPERDLRRRSKSLGFLETDIDTFESRQVLETDLDEAVARVAYEIAGLLHQQQERVERASSMLAINDKRGTAARKDEETNGVLPEDRAKSMDFLLDDDNRAAIIPPENSLRQNQAAAAAENGKNGKSKSEHEIRFERSLQNLTLPEWYKQSDWSKKPKEGFLLKRENEKRWDGFRTPSCTSLTSVGSVTNASTRSVIIPKRVTRPDWRYVSSLRSSRDSIPSSAESASPRDAASFQYGVSGASDPLSRWSSSRLSTSSTPANSSWSLYRSYRQPYLGWRHAVASSQGAQTPCSSRSGAPSPSPSPAPSTPQTGSRPVSPGRSPGDLSFQQPPWVFPKYWMPGDPHKPKDIPETDSDPPTAPHRRRRKSRDRSREDLSPDDLKNDPGNSRHAFAPPDDEYAGNSAGNKMSRDRYSYIQSIYNSDPKLERLKSSRASPANEDDSVATDGSLKSPLSSSSASPQVFWMESSFVGSRTTSVVLLPDGKTEDERRAGSPLENGQGGASQRSPSVNCGELSRSSTSERLAPGRSGDGDSATSMEEVLDSLLAIPSTSRSASPLISRRESPVQIRTTQDASSPDKKTKLSSPSHEKTVTFKEPHSETLHYDSDDLALFPPPASPSPPPAPPSPPIPLPPMYQNYYPSAYPLPPPPLLSEPVDALRTPTLPATPPPTPVTQESTEGSFTDLPVCRSSQNEAREKIDDRLTSPVIEKDEQGFIRLNMDDTPLVEKDKEKRKNKKERGNDSEDGTDGPGDSRQGSIRNASTIRCRRPNCKRSLPTEEARVKFRTCSNCYTFYCSRQCRKAHYERHKSQCPRTRISNLCTQVLMKVREDPRSRRHLSICATRGLLSRGRGVVKLVFLNAEDALDYLCNGWESLKGQTFYVPRTELMPQEMGAEVFGQVRILCDKYNTDRKFILLAAISVVSEVRTDTPEGLVTVNVEREVVVRGVKMRLAPPLPEDEVQTLICTVTNDPPVDGKMDATPEDLRKGLDVIDSQMEERGVNLSESYPEVYAKIVNFVEKSEPFVPFNIFPVDKRNGKMFMCILLPWADGEIMMKISSKTTASRSRRKWII